MRVLGIGFFASAGGDFHPLVAIAAGLRARGHHVQLFCDPEGAQLVADTGIGTVVDEEGWAAAARVDDELGTLVPQAAPEERARLVAEWLTRRTNTLFPASVRAVKQARPDVLVSATLAAPLARDAAGDTGTAWCIVNSTYDMARAPETPVAEWFAPALRAAPLVLHATDAVFDDGEPVPGREYVGPLFWEPSAPVPSYLLETGPPWALVSVSLAPQGDIALVPAALKAISALGLRGVATIGEKNDPAAVGPLPPGAHLENSLSHAAVLERAALLVSHAGHGSVSKALWYGVPMVLVPWGRDQPGVALRAERLGVARVISPDQLDTLPDAIADVMTHARYRTNAASHALRIQSGDPLTLACERIEAYVADTDPS